MASNIKISDALKNGALDSFEVGMGASVILRVYDGAQPADESTALSGNTLLAEGTLPSDWLAAASAGSKAKNGTWTLTGQAGAAAGIDGTFFRLYRSNGTTCDYQGAFGETADTPDMAADNKNIATGQVITVTAFTLTLPSN